MPREGNCQRNRKYEPAEINTLLKRLSTVLKNKHGEEYEPDSLKVMILLLGRHLKNKVFCSSIVQDGILVHASRCWMGTRKSFAWLTVESVQTKLDRFQQRRKKFSGRARNSVVKIQNLFNSNNVVSVEGKNTTELDWGISVLLKVMTASNLLSAEGPKKTSGGGLSAKDKTSQDSFSVKCSRPGDRDVQLPDFVSTSAVGVPISRRVVHFISR